MKQALVFSALLLVSTVAGCGTRPHSSFFLTSPAFNDGAAIPLSYTCDGQNTSPELRWRGAPAATVSFALIMHDPDAPRAGGFTHWVIFNIPATANGLAAAITGQAKFGDGTVQGNNSAGAPGYTGPCPPTSETHHYQFHLYALDRMMNVASGATKDQLEAAMSGHILAEARLTGLFQ